MVDIPSQLLYVYDMDDSIPIQFVDDVVRATKIAIEYGCDEIYLFGSLATGFATPQSDIDLAVSGCPPELYYKMIADISRQVTHLVDVVLYDERDPFAQIIWNTGEKIRLV